MKKLLTLYQYIAPLILTPLAWWLWYGETAKNLNITLTAWLLPILWAYIVPGIGTNILKVWEFNTRFKLGRFRPHHGFVFGSATSVLAWLVHSQPSNSAFDVFRYGVIVAGVLGFCNILYEIKAVKVGILNVYNQPWADEQGAEAIVFDYAPWFFGGFGMVYGVAIATIELISRSSPLSWPMFVLFFMCSLVLTMAFPVYGFMRHSLAKHGHRGTRPVKKNVRTR